MVKKQDKAEYDGSTALKSVMQEMFVNNLLQGMPQYEAYEKAGYSSKSENALMANSTRLIRKDKTKARLDYKRAKLAKKAEITAEKVVAELAKVGFANIKDFIDRKNTTKDLSELPRELTAAVESIQTDVRHDNGKSEGYTEKVKFKLHSKLGALDKLAQHLGLYQAIEPNMTVNILINKA